MTGIQEIDTIITVCIDSWETNHPGIDRPANAVITELVLHHFPDSDLYAVLHTLMLDRVNTRVWEISL